MIDLIIIIIIINRRLKAYLGNCINFIKYCIVWYPVTVIIIQKIALHADYEHTTNTIASNIMLLALSASAPAISSLLVRWGRANPS